MDTRSGRIYERSQVERMGDYERQYMRDMDLAPTPIQRSRMRVSRNHPCPCGSGSKFKKCCLVKKR